MKRKWENCKAPNKGSVVEFVMKDDKRVTGYYLGFDEEKQVYILSHSTYEFESKYFIKKDNIKTRYVLALR